MSFISSILPQRPNQRPSLACEIAPGGILAARRLKDGSAATAFAPLPTGIVTPSLATANFTDPGAVTAALHEVLDDAAGHEKWLTLVIPDAAVRVLLLDFDTLPAKAQDIVPILRFRLRKLVPFDADEAALGYQILRHDRSLTRVLTVITPSTVRAEYESVVRVAGHVPGALLPSTLSTLAALSAPEPTLVLNRNGSTATTAITREDDLLLHRSLELPSERATQGKDLAEIISVTAAYFEDTLHAAPATLHYAGPGGAVALLDEIGQDLPNNLRVRDLAPIGNSSRLTTASAISTAAVLGALAS